MNAKTNIYIIIIICRGPHLLSCNGSPWCVKSAKNQISRPGLYFHFLSYLPSKTTKKTQFNLKNVPKKQHIFIHIDSPLIQFDCLIKKSKYPKNKTIPAMWIKSLRLISILIGLLNLLVVVLGGIVVSISFPGCRPHKVLPIIVVSFLSAVRIGTMIGLGIAQEATAKIITRNSSETQVLDAVIRQHRRVLIILSLALY